MTSIPLPPARNRLLMCPPDYYRIEYEINPWMSLKNQADTGKARKQWEDLYKTLTDHLKVPVDLISPQPGLPDMVFTANAGLVADRKVYLSNFKCKERQGERKFFKEWFVRNQYETVSLPENMAFEGEGDALWMGKVLFAGYPFRSDLSSHLFLSKSLPCEAVSLELVDPRFYHLDTCFCPINSRLALFVPEAFSPNTKKILTSLVDQLIPLKPEEARCFAANAIVVNEKIIFQTGADSTRRKLEKEGMGVFPLDLSEFIKAGGNAKCLVLWI